MAEFKLVISDKGKSKQIEIKDDLARSLIGKKIGDKFDGELLDMAGYEFEITGGSDSSGKAMRPDVDTSARKNILSVHGIGIKKKAHGLRQRKLLAGNTIYEKTSQINLKVLKKGKKDVFAESAQPAEESKQEAPVESPKEEAKEEKSAEEPKEEAPAEEKPEEKKENE